MSTAIRCKCLIYLSAGLISSGSFATDFNQLVADPKLYTGKRVSVVGVAAVDGPHFVLYEPPRASTMAGFGREILISPPAPGPRYLHLNNHWVRITGIAYPRQRPTDYYGCIIFLERVDMLNKPPVNEPEILALFANKGSIPVQVKLYGNDGAIAAELELGVHGIDETSVERLGDGTVRVFDLAGKLLSSARVPSHRDAANFDIPLGTFYYQIEDGKVRPVPVKDAGPLKKRWKEIQEQTQRRAS